MRADGRHVAGIGEFDATGFTHVALVQIGGTAHWPAPAGLHTAFEITFLDPGARAYAFAFAFG